MSLIADVKGEYRLAGGDVLGKELEHLREKNVIIAYGRVLVIVPFRKVIILKAEVFIDV